MINKEPNVMFSIGGDEWPGLSKLAEECGEVTQIIGKLMGTGGRSDHWDGTNLRERLIEEIGDVLAACEFVADFNLMMLEVHSRRDIKLSLFEKWRMDSRIGIRSEVSTRELKESDSYV